MTEKLGFYGFLCIHVRLVPVTLIWNVVPYLEIA